MIYDKIVREVKSHPKDRIQLEIGDTKQAGFKPQVKFMRWDNEVNFSIRAQEHPDFTVESQGGKTKYITPDYEVHMYEKPEASEDGGFEFEWIFSRKPKSNVLIATTQHKGLVGYKQLALTEEEIANGTVRPENVIDSIAFYHEGKGGVNHADGMEYKAGKVGHAYRIKATDAKGNWVWGDQDWDSDQGDMRITVPQDFLDGAAYPVVVDPTFGYTSVGASLNNNGFAAVLVLFNPHTAAAGEIITDFNVSGKRTAGASTYTFAAYNLSVGSPYSRLAAAVSVVVNSATVQWWTASAGSQAMTAGVSYGVAAGSPDSNDFISYDDPGSGSNTELQISSATLGTTWDRFSVQTNKYSVYATYSAAVAPLALYKQALSLGINI